MRNNSAEYKLFQLFCTRLRILLSYNILTNYLNIIQTNWDNYSIIYNNNRKSENNDNLINKILNYTLNWVDLNKLYDIYN